MIWKRRVLAAVTWAVLSLVVAVIVYRLPAVYRAETVILVESQRIPERFVPPTVNTDLKDRLATLGQQILSYTRLLQIINNFDLYRQERKTRTQEEIVELMKADVGIKLEPAWTTRDRADNRPSAFRISYQGANPEIVAMVANQLGGFFIDENLRSREVQAVGTSEFLGTQLAEAKKKLEEQEAKLSVYKIRFNGELPEQENILLASLGQVQIRLQATTEALNRAEQQKTTLESVLASTEYSDKAIAQLLDSVNAPDATDGGASGSGQANGVLASQDLDPRKLPQLRRALQGLRVIYGDNHPDVVSLRSHVAALEQMDTDSTTAERPQTPSSAAAGAPKRPRPSDLRVAELRIQNQERIRSIKTQIEVATSQIEAATAQRDRLVEEIGKAQSRLMHLPIREQELAVVKRDYEISRANYQSLLDKGLSADLAAEMERRQKAERFLIVDAARVPQKPVKPNRPLLYVAGTVLSLMAGIVVGLAREVRTNTVLGELDLPKGLPVLGRIPTMVPFQPIHDITPPPRRRRAWILVLLVSLVVVAVCFIAAAEIFGWIPRLKAI